MSSGSRSVVVALTVLAAACPSQVRERLAALGVDPWPSTPDDFSRFIAAEIMKWGKIIKASGAKVE